MMETLPDANANGDQPAGLVGSQQSLDEADFITDRDLNWLCGYEGGEGGGTTTPGQQRCPELMGSHSYNQLSCHVDATLAEIDMDQFCRADIDKILEISAYSNDLYGEQGLFSNISMDSLDCSSFEADEMLPSLSLEADDSSSGALATTEDGGTTGSDRAIDQMSSDAAAVTTSGEAALVTSDDATDPSSAPHEFRQWPAAGRSRPGLTCWSERRRTPSPHQHTTWVGQRQSPPVPPAPRTETTTWREQCLPPSAPQSPPPWPDQHRAEPDRAGTCQVEPREDEPRSDEETTPVRMRDKAQPRRNDLRRYLLSADPRQRLLDRRGELTLPERPAPAECRCGGRRPRPDLAGDRGGGERAPDRAVRPVTGSEPRPVAATAAVAERSSQTAPSGGGLCVFPHYTLPCLPFLEQSPISAPCRHGPGEAAAGAHRAPLPESPAPPTRRAPGPPSLTDSRGPASPVPTGSRGPASPVLSGRGAGSRAPLVRPRVGSPALAGCRVGSPVPPGRLTPTATGSPQRRPYSCNDIRTAIRGNMAAIQDWRSLRMLLPQEFRREMDRLAGDALSPDGPSGGLHVGQCRSASRQSSAGSGRRDSDAATDDERDGRCTPRSARLAAASGSSTSSGRSLSHWFTDAAQFAAVSERELRPFTGPEDASDTVSHPPSAPSGAGKTGSERRRQHPSVDSGIELRMPGSFGAQSAGSDSSRSESDSHARRVIVLHRDGFEEALSLITESVSSIVAYFQSSAISLSSNDPVGGQLLGDSRRSPAIGYLVLDRLCPALYTLLGDGLLTRLDTAFGPVHNSVWRLVESACPPGICPQPLSDLVLKVNNEEELSESVLKFNAFVFGLLNTQSLDRWFGWLLGRPPALLKHYSAEALVRQLGAADADRLLLQLRRLARPGFAIELTFESQLLRQSLWRLGRRLMELGADPSGGRTAGAGPPARQARVTAAAIRGKLERRWTGRDLDRRLLAALTETLAGCVPLDTDENDNSAAAAGRGAAPRAEPAPAPAGQRQTATEPKTKPRGRGRDPARTAVQPNPSQPGPKPNTQLRPEPKQETKVEIDAKKKPQPAKQNRENFPERHSDRQNGPDYDPERQPEPEPLVSRARARQLDEWWQRVTRDQSSSQPWWERQSQQPPAGRASPPAESRIPRRVSGTPAGRRPSSDSGYPQPAAGRRAVPAGGPQSPDTDGGRQPALAATGGSRRLRTASEASLRQRVLKRDQEQANQSREAARSGPLRPAAGTGTGTAAARRTGAATAESRQGKRVRSLVPYHTPNRQFLSYDRDDTLTVVGTTDSHWLLCARHQRVGLVTRHHVTNVS
ncbi:uncharacterized protein LOC122364734 [Amphibalanus amphitrite]|uniref:uncharacterized protein LOC122364734 n=1 Tax=Amphibalanus amphitrite TaxID=1232801 RepID=UPI001C91BDD4|nr:uncharacterized protein LOC122364734 [Amphibalanus amphitrite]